jgi:transcriptional regulator with XRE-family HTH domain
MKEIGRKLYLLRILHNYTQNYIAEQVDISGSTYIAIEQGLGNVHYARLASILGIYDLTINNFFSFTEQDILDVVRGQSVISQNMEHLIYSRVIAKLEALNQVLCQTVQALLNRGGEGTGQWNLENK